MAFFQKLKKLKFWTKRGKRVTKVENRKEDVEHNLKGQSSEEDVEHNLKGQSSEEDVERNLLEHIEDLKRKLEEKDATICGLEKIVEEQNIEREQVEATLRGHVTVLEKTLEERDRERKKVEATLQGKIKKLEDLVGEREKSITNWHSKYMRLRKEFLDADMVKKEAESTLCAQTEYYERKQQQIEAKSENVEGRDLEREEVEATPNGQIMELEYKLVEEQVARVHAELKLHLKIRELREKLVHANRDKKEGESALRAQTEYYERKLQEMEARSANVEGALNGVIKGLQKQLEEAYRVTREHKEYCERKQQERDAESRKVVDTLNRVINRLQKELQEAASKHRDTLHRLYTMGAETRCERNTATKRIKELENKVRGKESERKNVEDKLHCIIRDLNKKLHIRNSDKKEGESAVCGKMKKLMAAAVVMVVMLLMVFSFTNYGVTRG